MDAAKLKNLISILLIATGVLHIVVAAVGAAPDLRWPLVAFGALYAAIGVWVRRGDKLAVILAIAAPLVGLVLGGARYLQYGGPVALPAMFLIDIVVIGAGIAWLTKSGKAA